MTGIAGLLAEFLERLDLTAVTLVVNDWGGGQLLVADRQPAASPASSSPLARRSTTSRPGSRARRGDRRG